MTPSTSTSNDRRTQEYLRLLGQHEARLVGFIFSLVPHWADANDVAQEVRIALWNEFDKYDAARDFGAWARTIAYYEVLTYRKKRQKQLRRNEPISIKLMELLATDAAAISDELDTSQQSLRDCFEKLPEAKQELLLRYYSDEVTRHIAATTGRTVDATRQAIVRARLTLRKCVDDALEKEKRL